MSKFLKFYFLIFSDKQGNNISGQQKIRPPPPKQSCEWDLETRTTL